MAYQIDIKKLIKDIRGPKGVAALSEELAKVSNEVQKLRATLQPQAEEKIRKARLQMNELQQKLKTAQGELDRELTKTVTLVKKYGKEAEVQFKKLKQIVTENSSKSARSAKASSARKTSKKAGTKKRAIKK